VSLTRICHPNKVLHHVAAPAGALRLRRNRQEVQVQRGAVLLQTPSRGGGGGRGVCARRDGAPLDSLGVANADLTHNLPFTCTY
jgi:hypothetical protein